MLLVFTSPPLWRCKESLLQKLNKLKTKNIVPNSNKFLSTATPLFAPTAATQEISTTAAITSSNISIHTHTLLKQCKSLIEAKAIHKRLIVSGDPDLMTHLVGTYVSLQARFYALAALQNLTPSSAAVFWWNAFIRSSVNHGFLRDALDLYRTMRRLEFWPDVYTFPFVLKACSEIPSLRYGSSVHASVCIHGVDLNVFVGNAIIALYGRCGALGDACLMFDEMSQRGICDVVSWNSIVSAFVQSGEQNKALQMFEKMTIMCDFRFRADAISLVNILTACASVRSCIRGKQVHAYAVRRGLFGHVFVGNALVDMYAKCDFMDEANKVFEKMEVKDVVSWNAMVTGYSQIGRFEDALGLFEKMREEKIELNVVTWSAVIAGYAQRNCGHKALDVFRQMQSCGSEPNVVTLVSLLSGCASAEALLQGKETHCYAIKCVLHVDGNDTGDDMMVINGLIDMYAKCKSARIARSMFDSIAIEEKSVVTWTVMIGGHAQHGEANDALELFSQMLKHNKIPNAFTISCALMACAHLSALRFGGQVHAHVLRNHYDAELLYVSNCLIDMYAKCGDVDAAQVVFNSMIHRNTVSWTSLMTGFGMHGRGVEALQVFDRMRREGQPIDGVTFVVLLYACSHSGMVNEGMNYFNNMMEVFGIVPEVEHYACMVDLLGRAGRLNEAMKLITDMPVKPTPIIWAALLSACRNHADVELGEYAAARLSELESENDGTYTLLSNIYANARRWKDVASVRSLMKHTGIKKRPGCSWVQGRKGTASFFAGDKYHPLSKQIYHLLADLIDRIKANGYLPQTSFALHDVDDEEKGDLLSEHSEKLALAYGILTSAPGVPIRITKNLRVCGDCHSAMTYISKIIDHEIILRDSSRFHHFKNGSCTCRGYW